ncbi:MAG: 16S rRNA (uracil(1498)-N(3))-methyltransferase [Verrucomicrobia bacterium]|nr:16S rRNA (uracil(1498)-N(3))-methyltransferase [Verrucomicrobiota bacterium]
MRRFFLPPEQCRSKTLTLSDREAHHALHVLRLRLDERLAVLDGRGHEFHCRVSAVQRHDVVLEVLQKNYSPPLPCSISLMQAIPKGKTMDTIVQKATELGVARIVPILSERTTVQLDEEDAATKSVKWRATAIESIKQCGSTWLPALEPALSPKEFLARGERFDLHLIASLQNDSQHLRRHLERFRTDGGTLPKTIAVWVGPEGDFTPAELSATKSAGALPITLGPLILRCDTAALYCLSILNYELQSPVDFEKQLN